MAGDGHFLMKMSYEAPRRGQVPRLVSAMANFFKPNNSARNEKTISFLHRKQIAFCFLVVQTDRGTPHSGWSVGQM